MLKILINILKFMVEITSEFIVCYADIKINHEIIFQSLNIFVSIFETRIIACQQQK